LEACRRHNPSVKIVYAGTRGQYGKVSSIPVDEKAALQPIDINGIHKSTGEMYHLLYCKAYGIRAVSLRLTNTYGPRHCMKSGDQSFLNWFVRLVLEKKTIPVYGDGSAQRDFNYIDDVVDALLMSAASEKSDGEIFNLGSNQAYSILETAKLLISAAGEGSFELIAYPEERKSLEIGSYQGDFRKIQNALGWSPKIALEDGLHNTLQFYRENSRYYW
jgi:nucleoside-diphosphate-sugar epimerase